MKKITKEMIENVVQKNVQIVTERTAEMLLENMENCISNHDKLEDKGLANQMSSIMIPISTAYQISVCTMINVLCDLLCDEISE